MNACVEHPVHRAEHGQVKPDRNRLADCPGRLVDCDQDEGHRKKHRPGQPVDDPAGWRPV